MRKFIIFLTGYNIIFTLLRLLFLVLDPGNTLLTTLQFYDLAIITLFPVIILWSMLYLTIPTAIYYGVNGIINQVNRFNISALSINSLICLTYVIIIFNTGYNL